MTSAGKRSAQPRPSVCAEHLRDALATLEARPCALFVDVDGTLSPIVAVPEEARVLPACRRALRKLSSLVDVVVVMSGRRVDEARRMVGLDGLVYFGNHGLEGWDRTNGFRSWAGEHERAVSRALAALQEALAGLPGVRLEDKRSVISVHYRLAPDTSRARSDILKAARPVAEREGLRLTEGKRVVELRAPVGVDKGKTLVREVTQRGLRGVLCLGDDLTDAAAFRALRALRERGQVRGLALAVGGDEAPSELLAAADGVLAGPPEVAALLQELATALEAKTTRGAKDRRPSADN